MKVSIITVCFNSEKTISRTIESVLFQNYKNIEYIIIDGQSQDNTLKIVKSYIKKFKEKKIDFKIISEKDSGIYNAMNKGILLSSGDIIGIINSDDWYEPNAIETAVKEYIEKKYDMFFADLRIVKKSGNIIKKAKLRKIVVSRDWNHPTTFISRNIYEKFKYKEESIYDDFDLYLRIRKNSKKIVIKNSILANFSFGGISTKKSIKDTINRIKIRYKIYRNNGYNRLYIIECIFTELLKYLAA